MKKTYTMRESVRIKNVAGSSKRSSSCTNCGAWISHWEQLSGQVAGSCVVAGCNESAKVGAHITRPRAENEDYKTHPYIVPMCVSHNGEHEGEFDTKPNVTFVWANSEETCGS